MNAVCPSCDSPFEVDDALASGPGLPLCSACISAVQAPPPPPLPAGLGVTDPPPSSEGPPISSSEMETVAQRESARPAKKKKPSFFSVDSEPPPPPPPGGDEPPPSWRGPDSSHDDLRKLTAAHVDRPEPRNSDLFALRGALFGDAPRQGPLPPDLSLLVDVDFDAPEEPEEPIPPPPPSRSGPVLAPVLALDRLSEHPPAAFEADEASDPSALAFKVGKGAPLRPALRRPAARAAEPDVAAMRPSRSAAPGPVVSERRAAAAKRNGLAGWAVLGAVGSVTAVVIVVALRVGAGSKPDPVPSESASAVTVAIPAETAPPLAPSGAPPGPAQVAVDPAPSVVRTADPARDHAIERREYPAVVGPRTADTGRAVVERPPAPPPVVPTAAPAPPPAAAGADFDRGAAKAALAAAAGAAAGCKQPDDPSGGAKVTVTFAPSGRVSSARVVGPPFQGTKTGGCIAAAFRSASVPPFAGDPVAVTKDVSVR